MRVGRADRHFVMLRSKTVQNLLQRSIRRLIIIISFLRLSSRCKQIVGQMAWTDIIRREHIRALGRIASALSTKMLAVSEMPPQKGSSEDCVAAQRQSPAAQPVPPRRCQPMPRRPKYIGHRHPSTLRGLSYVTPSAWSQHQPRNKANHSLICATQSS